MVNQNRYVSGTNRFERRPLITLTVTLLGIFVILILGAEMVARWVQPLHTGEPFKYRIPHPRFGWALAPGESYVNRLPEESVPVTHSFTGWRDLPRVENKEEGIQRVLVLGDSFMEAYSVRFEDALPARLEQLISTAQRRVEVINFGVAGYGTLQEYLVFNAIGHAYRPDVVVLAMHLHNDLSDNSQALQSLVRLRATVASRPFLDPEVSEPRWRITQVDFESTQQRLENYRKRQNRLWRRSALLQLARSVIKSGSRARAKPKPRAYHERRYLAYFGAQYCVQPPEYTQAWDITRRILARLDYEVRVSGARLMVISVPAIHEVDEDEMAQISRDAPQPDKLCLQQAPAYQHLAKLLKELDIEYLDLLPVFRDTWRRTRTELFRRSDKHWNPQGHALAAQELAVALEDRGYLVRHESPVSP